MNKWLPIDVEDALELLSSQFSHDSVRQYAVTRLAQASDEVATDTFLCIVVFTLLFLISRICCCICFSW